MDRKAMIAILTVACLVVAGGTQKICAQQTMESAKTGVRVSTDAATSPYRVSAKSVTKADMSEAQLRVVHDQMVRRLTQGNAGTTLENKKAPALRVVANGTALGTPTSITVEALSNGTVKIEVVNIASGVVVMQSNASVSLGPNTVVLALGQLESGAYMIKVTQGQVIVTTSFNVAR